MLPSCRLFPLFNAIQEIINERCKKKLPVPIPAELLVLIAATVFSYFLDLSEEYNVQTIGFIPKGIYDDDYQVSVRWTGAGMSYE